MQLSKSPRFSPDRILNFAFPDLAKSLNSFDSIMYSQSAEGQRFCAAQEHTTYNGARYSLKNDPSYFERMYGLHPDKFEWLYQLLKEKYGDQDHLYTCTLWARLLMYLSAIEEGSFRLACHLFGKPPHIIERIRKDFIGWIKLIAEEQLIRMPSNPEEMRQVANSIQKHGGYHSSTGNLNILRVEYKRNLLPVVHISNGYSFMGVYFPKDPRMTDMEMVQQVCDENPLLKAYLDEVEMPQIEQPAQNSEYSVRGVVLTDDDLPLGYKNVLSTPFSSARDHHNGAANVKKNDPLSTHAMNKWKILRRLEEMDCPEEEIRDLITGCLGLVNLSALPNLWFAPGSHDAEYGLPNVSSGWRPLAEGELAMSVLRSFCTENPEWKKNLIRQLIDAENAIQESEEMIIKCYASGCKFTGDNGAELERHFSSTHSDIAHRTVTCPVLIRTADGQNSLPCGQKFLRTQQLSEHILKRHFNDEPEDGKNYRCIYKECNKSFSNQARMERHNLVLHPPTTPLMIYYGMCTGKRPDLEKNPGQHDLRFRSLCCSTRSHI